jgi:CobQ-like glutamine amidotransferase family enzyme
MIRLGVLFPEHLNLNGDYGNLEVIARQLEWRGMASEIVAVGTRAELTSDLDFLLVGHGSSAAWASIDSEFRGLLATLKVLLSAGMPGMSVSSGFEQMVRGSVFEGLTANSLSSRTSKFVVEQDVEGEVLGYLNADVDLPIIHRESNFIGTMLHGPILAKNPILLEEVLLKICSSAGLELAPFQANEKAGLLADLVDKVWELERELASE